MKLTMALTVAIIAAIVSTCSDVSAPPDPTIPVLIAPSEGAILDNGCADASDPVVWEFDWSDVTNATAYRLVVEGRNAIYPAINAIVSASGFRSESYGYVIQGNRFGWRWRVQALIDDEWMEWSGERTFHVEPLGADCS